MSKPVLFHGKPNQLEDVLTFVTLKHLVDGTTSDQMKSAVLASLFRGSALQWLTAELRNEPGTLEDYQAFIETIRDTFGLSAAAKAGQTAKRYANCYQKASVQLYAIEFKQLSTTLGIPDTTAVAQFIRGLKSHIREALVVTNQSGDLDDTIAEAQRIDSQLYSCNRGGTYKQHGRRAKTFNPSTGSAQSLDQHLDSLAHKFECDECDRTFRTQQSLDQHLDSPAHVFECEECDKTFRTEQSLDQHLDSPAHVFECEECDKTFRTEQSLAQHRQSLAHNKMRSFL